MAVKTSRVLRPTTSTTGGELIHTFFAKKLKITKGGSDCLSLVMLSISRPIYCSLLGERGMGLYTNIDLSSEPPGTIVIRAFPKECE